MGKPCARLPMESARGCLLYNDTFTLSKPLNADSGFRICQQYVRISVSTYRSVSLTPTEPRISDVLGRTVHVVSKRRLHTAVSTRRYPEKMPYQTFHDQFVGRGPQANGYGTPLIVGKDFPHRCSISAMIVFTRSKLGVSCPSQLLVAVSSRRLWCLNFHASR